jgi:hypothetical protein
LRHMLNLPSLAERKHILLYLYLNRVSQLPNSTLILDILPFFTKIYNRPFQHQWFQLLYSSPFVPLLCPLKHRLGLNPLIQFYRQVLLEERFNTHTNNIFLHNYRPSLKIDLIMYLLSCIYPCLPMIETASSAGDEVGYHQNPSHA